MTLDMVANTSKLSEALGAWREKQPSRLLDHGQSCCRLAREWFLAMDRSYLVKQTPSKMPSWIRERYEWGPSAWPIYWCQAVRLDELDCGVLAALTLESLKARDIMVLPVQLIKYYGEANCAQWQEAWAVARIDCNWISTPFAYHEACAVLQDGAESIDLWDPTGNYWIDPGQTIGYSTPVALRLINNDVAVRLYWGKHHIVLDSWHVLI